MEAWTHANTEDYTDDELNTLNAAQGWLEDENPDLAPGTISDAIGNAWIDDVNAIELYRRVARGLGVEPIGVDL